MAGDEVPRENHQSGKDPGGDDRSDANDGQKRDPTVIRRAIEVSEQRLAEARGKLSDRSLDLANAAVSASPGSAEEHAAQRAVDQARHRVEELEEEVERLREEELAAVEALARQSEAEEMRLAEDRRYEAIRAEEVALHTYWQVVRGDWISEGSKKERRLLLVVASVGWLVVITGLIPTRISALGITFSETERSALLFSLAAVSTYATVAFWIHTARDYGLYRSRVLQAGAEVTSKAWAAGDTVGNIPSSHTLLTDLNVWLDYRFPVVLGTSAVLALLVRAFLE